MIEVPALVNFGAESYRNNVEMSVDEFYVRFAAAPELPTTSQPPPQLFADAYRQALAEGAQHIFVCTVSAKLSGTYSSAVMAAQDVGAERVTVWDGDSASMGSGWQAIEAARRIEAGDSLEAMLAHVSQVRSQTLGYVTVETLRYLARSGRVSNVQAGIGDLLSVKPILRLQHGVLEPIGRVRGRKRSLAEILTRIRPHVGAGPANAAVVHANALEEAQALAAEACAALPIQELLIAEVGPAIASLTGPGCVGLMAFPAAPTSGRRDSSSG
jgi:DegV family protein with EDD domain